MEKEKQVGVDWAEEGKERTFYSITDGIRVYNYVDPNPEEGKEEREIVEQMVIDFNAKIKSMYGTSDKEDIKVVEPKKPIEEEKK